MYKSLGSASGQKTANGYAAHRLLLRFHFAEESSRVGRSCLALDNRVNRARISLMPMLAVVMKMAKQSEAVKRLLTGAWLVAGALALGAPATSSAINAVAPSAGAIQQDAPAAPNAAAARYSAGVADIVKMVDAKVDPQIVKAYIQNSPTAYNPSATEIIALKDRGVGPDILTAMLQHGAEVRTQAMRAAPGAANPPLPQAPSGVANPYAPGYDNSVQAAYPAYPYTYADTSYAYAYPSYCYGGYNYGSCWPWYWPSFSFGCYPYGGYCGYPYCSFGFGYPYCCGRGGWGNYYGGRGYYGGHGYYGGGYYGGRGYYGGGYQGGHGYYGNGYAGGRGYGGFSARSGSFGGRSAGFHSVGGFGGSGASGHSSGGFGTGRGFGGHAVSFSGHGGGMGGHSMGRSR